MATSHKRPASSVGENPFLSNVPAPAVAKGEPLTEEYLRGKNIKTLMELGLLKHGQIDAHRVSQAKQRLVASISLLSGIFPDRDAMESLEPELLKRAQQAIGGV